MNLFQEYECSSGQLVNQAKSAFYLHDKFARRATAISRVTGFSRKNIPFTYLGVPTTNGRLQTIYFKHLVDKSRHALEGWKHKLLTFGGRVTLINSVLSSFSIHTLASTVVPKTVLRRIESLMAQFLWSAHGEARNHWINWPSICSPKAEGGRVHSLTQIKDLLHAKLMWQFMEGGIVVGSIHGR